MRCRCSLSNKSLVIIAFFTIKIEGGCYGEAENTPKEKSGNFHIDCSIIALHAPYRM